MWHCTDRRRGTKGVAHMYSMRYRGCGTRGRGTRGREAFTLLLSLFGGIAIFGSICGKENL